jgi:hypothetical protein
MHAALHSLDMLVGTWFDLKTMLEHSIVFNDDALHVLAGVLLQLLAAAVLRSWIGRAAPWLIVFALELANEASDLWVELWPQAARSAQLGEGLKDVLLTMALPTLLLATARWFPGVLQPRR